MGLTKVGITYPPGRAWPQMCVGTDCPNNPSYQPTSAQQPTSSQPPQQATTQQPHSGTPI